MKGKNIIITLTIGILGGIIGSLLFLQITSSNKNDHKGDSHDLVANYTDNKGYNSNYRTVSLSDVSNSGMSDFTFAAEKGLPSVVHVQTQYNQPNYTLYDFIFGTAPSRSTPVMASGSGVIISSDGYVVTNNHVIENAEVIEIVLNNKQAYPAELVGRDGTTDLALLKIDATNLPYMEYGNSDDVKIGEWVLAIGNPFNLTSTATAGIISAKARNINIMNDNMAIESFIQTDAAVNPGNSGGALVNTNGELIGINTAIASKTGSFVGYSFAIPVNIVRKVVADLVEFGEVQRAYLGLELVDIDANIAKKFGLKNIEGIYVAKIWQNGAGEKAGIKEGDIILEVNSHKVNSSSELLENISQYRPGDEIEIRIRRESDTHNKKIKLQNKHGHTSIVKSRKIEQLGASFEPISEYDKTKLKIKNGLQVKNVVAGKFATTGIKKDYIIVKVNNNFVNTVEDLEKEIKNSSDGRLFIEGIYPNGSTAYYALKL